MRLLEFSNAEEQLALWKLVSDSVWQAIEKQAEEQKIADAEKARLSKTKKFKPTASKKPKNVPFVPITKTAIKKQVPTKQQLQKTKKSQPLQKPQVNNQVSTQFPNQVSTNNTQHPQIYPQQQTSAGF